jgi:hypothetical protein
MGAKGGSYHRRRRVGGRPVEVYLGSGPAASAAARPDWEGEDAGPRGAAGPRVIPLTREDGGGARDVRVVLLNHSGEGLGRRRRRSARRCPESQIPLRGGVRRGVPGLGLLAGPVRIGPLG